MEVYILSTVKSGTDSGQSYLSDPFDARLSALENTQHVRRVSVAASGHDAVLDDHALSDTVGQLC